MNGKTEPRIFTPPLRELTPETSLGFACIEYAENVLHEKLYPFQAWLFVHMLEIIGDLQGEWYFRFRTVVILVARQNGKTKVSAILASFFLNVLGAKSVFGTSLNLDKAEETWECVVEYQTEIRELGGFEKISRTNGKKYLKLNGGGRYKTSAPTRRGGRGDTNTLALIDELREQRDWKLWSAAAPSTKTEHLGMTVGFSNAGDPDSVVLRQLRSTAIAAIEGGKAEDYGGEDIEADSLGLFEWSAPEGAAVDDEEALAQANPALGYGKLTMRALISDRKTMTESDFRAEDMCQQVATILPAPFPDGAWDAGTDPASRIADTSPIYYGVDLSANRTWAAIAACGQREDGNYHVEVIARRVGTEWVLDWFRERAPRGKMPLAFQSRGAPVTGLAEQACTIDGVERCAIEGTELTSGWGRFWDAVAAGEPTKEGEEARGGVRIYHLPQPVMDTPAKSMQLKKLGTGLDVPDRSKSPDDIAPLFACIMAFTAATAAQKTEKKIYESAYASGAPLVFV